MIYNGKTLKKIKEIGLSELHDKMGSGIVRFKDYALLDNRTILFATSQGLRKVSYDKSYSLKVNNSPCQSLPVLNSCSIETIEVIGAKEIFVAGKSQLYKFNLGLTRYLVYDESLAPSESEWINSIQSIYNDGKVIWLSCEDGFVMLKNTNNPFTKYFYDQNSGIKLEHLRSVFVLPNGDIISGLSSGLVYINHADGTFAMKDKLHLYHHIFLDRSNITHVFNNEGMYILSSKGIKTITDIHPEFLRFKTYPVNSHIFLGDSAILLGTENDNGVLLWNYKKHTVTNFNSSTRPSLASNIVNNVYKDKSNRVFVLSDNMITELSKNFNSSQSIDFKAHKEYSQNNLFFDMCEADGDYWIASYGNGILQIDRHFNIKKLIKLKDGLCDEGVYNLFNIGDSDLIITSNIGLSVYHIKTQKFKNIIKKKGYILMRLKRSQQRFPIIKFMLEV